MIEEIHELHLTKDHLYLLSYLPVKNYIAVKEISPSLVKSISLLLEINGEEGISEEKVKKIGRELAVAAEIVLHSKSFIPGYYKMESQKGWVLVKPDIQYYPPINIHEIHLS